VPHRCRGQTIAQHDASPRSYRCAPGITWVQDAAHTLVVQGASGQSWTLTGVEEAIWNWLTLGYEYDQVVRLLALGLGAAADEALCTVLHDWRAKGLLGASREEAYGQPGD
jgi:hypothetical protein